MGGFITRVIAQPKAQEQPRVASQMDAVKPTSVPAGPTTIEMTARRRLGISKRGRSATILTSITGASDDLTLGRKTLLG